MADLLRSNNPVLKEKAFAGPIVAGETMTIQGTVNKTGVVRATRGFKLGVIAATGAIALVYVVNLVMTMFFHSGISILQSHTPLGIGISVVIVIVAALNLVLDFDMIETAAKMGAPKYMEWYSAFALMVTLVWLYFEILRLLSKFRER